MERDVKLEPNSNNSQKEISVTDTNPKIEEVYQKLYEEQRLEIEKLRTDMRKTQEENLRLAILYSDNKPKTNIMQLINEASADVRAPKKKGD